MREVWLSADDGCRLFGMVTEPVGAPASHMLLWFGGRNEDVRWTPALASWLGPRFAVASFAYRGHLGSPGRPSQRAVVRDGVRIVRWLQGAAEPSNVELLIAGRSLGASVALQVLAQLPATIQPAGLILLSPIDSVRSLVARHPLLAASAWALPSPFDSMAVVERAARCPALVLLAEQDRQVAHDRSRRLAAALARRTSVTVHAIAATDHRTLPRSADTLRAMAQFAQCPGVRPAPQRPGTNTMAMLAQTPKLK